MFFIFQTSCLKVQIFWRLMMQLAPSRTTWLQCCVTWRSHSCLSRMLPAGDILTAETRAGILTCKCWGHSVGFVHCWCQAVWAPLWALAVDVLHIKRDWKLFLINCSLCWRAIESLLCLNLINSGSVFLKYLQTAELRDLSVIPSCSLPFCGGVGWTSAATGYLCHSKQFFVLCSSWSSAS